MIADSYGNIIEINEHAYKTFYGKNLPLVKLKLVSSKIKSLLLENIADKIKAQALIDFFSKTVIETYKNDISCIFGRKKRYFNVIISPIIGRKNKIIGKLAIFRDTTELNHLQSRLRKEAIRDFLTGAYNRRFFNESLLIEVNRYKRYGFPFCLLMIDIDKFKKVNDDEGHLKGDYILTEAVKIFKKNIRTHLDIVARYGGDEFAVILTNTSLTEAGSIAGRILLQYRDMNLNNTTLSIGVCIYEDNMEMKEMIRNADKAMYSAKANGGDNFSFSK